ncbi:MAG: hypothetical protein P1V97_15155 [Planctomycetota bacterium]|nr:hypothetical protein [Planctomycetota bacterium]
MISSSEPLKDSVEQKTDQSTNWDEFGGPDIAVQEARSIQQDQELQNSSSQLNTPSGSVPKELECSTEECHQRGAMYSAYSKKRLCLAHARKFDRAVLIFKAFSVLAALLIGGAILVLFATYIPWAFLITTLIIAVIIVPFSGLLS